MGTKLCLSSSKQGIEPIEKSIKEEMEEIEIEKHFKVTSDNKIIFAHKHNKENYEDLTATIEKEKNLLKLEDPEEIQAVLFKLKKGAELIKLSDEKKKFENFITTIENNYNLFVEKMRELFLNFKEIYLKNQKFLTENLRGQSTTANDYYEAKMSEEKSKEFLFEKFQKYHRFSNEIIFINNFIKNISPDLKDKINNKEELSKFYDENIKDFSIIFDESKKEQQLNFLMFLPELINFFKSKNEILDKFFDVCNKKSSLFLSIIKSYPDFSLDTLDSLAELNEYFQIMIKHRFIRHIETNYKHFSKAI